MEPLERLLEVQEHDLAVDRLNTRRAGLPERSSLLEAERRGLELAGRTAELSAERDQLSGRQSTLEAEVASLGERIHTIERRLYGGEVSASRELQAMADEVKAMERRRSRLEDDIVELMEAIEPLEAGVEELEAEGRALEEEKGRLAGAIAESESVIDAEVAAETGVRASLAEELPADLASRYESLRRRLGGVGAARLVHGTCDGCHLSLPAVELDRVRHAPHGTVSACEQCGRILVP